MAYSTRQQALSLFRRILRAGKRWQVEGGSKEEADYIVQEARQQFRAHQHNNKSDAAAKLLEEGERRLALALHYRIAYPRLWHADQFEKVPYVQPPQLDATDAPEAVVKGVKDKDVAAKLAAAARRRKERQAQQRQQQQQQQQGAEGPRQQQPEPS